jgi:hypothetical protein
LFGFGVGFASSQLTNVILSDIAPDKAGVASGANSTVRQVGGALGVAIVGSVFTTLTVRRAVDALHATDLPARLRDTVISGVRAQGASFPVPRGTPAADAAAIQDALAHAITDAVRPAMLIAAGSVLVGALVSLLLPRRTAAERAGAREPLVESLVGIEPAEPDPRQVYAPDH